MGLKRSRIRPTGTARNQPGTPKPPQPQVRWQIPAVGTDNLTVDEAMDLAEYLRENADDEWLEFILLDPPEVVAQDLAFAATEAKLETALRQKNAAERELDALKEKFEERSLDAAKDQHDEE